MKRISALCSSLAGCLLLASWVIIGSGCEGGGGGISNDDPGDNDVNVYVAIGDSITAGSQCNCTPYPQQLSARIGKTVHNLGVGGEISASCSARTGGVISRYKPGFMLILTGINDLIHGMSPSSARDNVRNMIHTCRNNHVVPVVATYPIPMGDHAYISGLTITLNSLLRSLASSEGAHLVDLASEFGDSPELMMADGLHPNASGTAVIAAAFADAL